ncbi:CRTAC1 family protein [Verrucomicrobiales bacterium]|nr:CRTAC1 family protein [Verrucomicrobiales bacterium]
MHHFFQTLLISLLTLGICSCGNKDPEHSTGDKKSVKFSEDQKDDLIKKEFLEIAERIESSRDQFHGRLQTQEIENALQLALKENPPNPQKIIGRWFARSFDSLRLGENSKAAKSLNEVFAIINSTKIAPSPPLFAMQALVELRQAEYANCIQRHNRDCCIFPLAGQGIHANPNPANRSMKALLKLLQYSPDDLRSQWLLNITAMATGTYPESVPEKYRVPESALKSEFDIGQFIDVAPNLGLDTFNLCGGAIVEDFDNDGFLDIVSSTSDPRGSLSLFRNTGDGKFVDLTKGSGLDDQLGGLNCIAADYDNDGDADILVLRGAWMNSMGKIRNSLLRNNGSSGPNSNITFTDVTRTAGLAEPAFPTQAASWGDYDNDGDLDLYVVNESQSGPDTSTESHFPSQLFRNNGDGTFTDIAAEAGVRNDRFSKGVTAGDYDNDGDLDLYVSNVGKNRLYRNDLSTNSNDRSMKFTDVAEELGLTSPEGYSFAPWFFDFNNDGWLDLFVTAFESSAASVLLDYRGLPHGSTPPCLYLNNNGRFEEVAKASGLDHPYLPMGANFGDLDNDGFLDVYLGTGDPDYRNLVPNVMLRNDRGQKFQNVTTSGGFGHLQKGHGIAFADFDHDGDQDIFHQLGGFLPGDRFHNALYLNPGHKNHYIAIQLVGTKSNRSGLGARIEVITNSMDGQSSFHRAVGSVSSFGGSPLSRIEIGIGQAESIKEVKITWPASGHTQSFTDIPLDSMVRFTEEDPAFLSVERQSFTLSVEAN